MSDVDKCYQDYWARHRARDVMYQTLRARCVSCEDRPELNEQVIFDRTRRACWILVAATTGSNASSWRLGFRDGMRLLDPSSEEQHEYAALSEITGEFDAILCLEVIEHMSLNDYVDLMDVFGKLLSRGGVLVLPMWAGDPGNVKQFPIADPAADLVVCGHEVKRFAYVMAHGRSASLPGCGSSPCACSSIC